MRELSAGLLGRGPWRFRSASSYTDPDFNADVQMLIGLGAVVRVSSQLEFGLRSLFCALEGSKYAAITAAGQSTDWLLGMSEALLKCNVDISHKHRIALTALLKRSERQCRSGTDTCTMFGRALRAALPNLCVAGAIAMF